MTGLPKTYQKNETIHLLEARTTGVNEMLNRLSSLECYPTALN